MHVWNIIQWQIITRNLNICNDNVTTLWKLGMHDACFSVGCKVLCGALQTVEEKVTWESRTKIYKSICLVIWSWIWIPVEFPGIFLVITDCSFSFQNLSNYIKGQCSPTMFHDLGPWKHDCPLINALLLLKIIRYTSLT